MPLGPDDLNAIRAGQDLIAIASLIELAARHRIEIPPELLEAVGTLADQGLRSFLDEGDIAALRGDATALRV
jgi:hypothetical protein